MQRCQADSTHAAGNQEHALRNSEARLQALFDSTPDALVISDAEGRITMANQQVETLLGYTVSELLGLSIDFLIPENARASHAVQRIAFAGNSAARRMGQGLEVRARRKDGSECDVEISLSRVRTEEGQLFASALRDISQRKYADEQLRISAVAFEAREGMVVTDEKFHILRTNRAFTELTGYSAEEVLGKTSHILRSERYSGGAFQLMHDCIQRNGSWQGESWDRRKTGEVYPIWLRISAVKNKDGMVTHYIGTGHDITERKRAEEKINELAFFDQLTGLPNRTLLLDRLQQVVAGNMRNKRFSSLLFIDLDHFKTLNDTLGHNMGDQLLKQVAHRLKLCVREGDTVARFGGDEFVVVLKDVGANALEAASGTEVVGEKILAALDQTYELSDISHRSTASIGATVFNGQAPAIDDWMKQADLAMYRSKSAGRNAFRFFDPSMETVVKERAAMEDDLERALLLKQFALHYQAQIEGDGNVTGAEVLLR
ncbi:MAG: PAS domain S-box protein, partial [Rhodoferax sp.]|nr:PAS domain S-box protein [Rhodoferax sp.]